MAYKNTVAIIGATSPVGAVIAKSMAANYRLLLMDEEQPQLILLQNELQAANKNAEVDALHCCKNASWEADIIVVAIDGEKLDVVAKEMGDVSNCKGVLHFTSLSNDTGRLQTLLPHAKVVSILWSPLPFDGNINAFIHGTDKETMDTAKTILAILDFQLKVS